MESTTLESQQLAFTRASAMQATGLPGHTIDDAIANGELLATRSGRRLIILREDLVEWLRRCRTKGEIPSRVTSDADKERLAQLNRERKQKAEERRAKQRAAA
jgi:excisionase family DNA binding protein